MPDTSEQRAGDVGPRGLPLGGGGCTAAFGLPFMLLGLLFFGLGLTGKVAREDATGASAFGLMFATAGSFLVVRGILGAWRARRRASWVRDHPREPWVGDHDWDRTGVDAKTPGSLGCLAFLGFVLMMLSPVVAREGTRAWHDEGFRAAWDEGRWWYAVDRHAPDDFQMILMLVAALVALASFIVVQAIRYRIRYGRARLEFDGFPFFLGEPLQGRVRLQAPAGGFSRLTMTLRFLEERNERGSRRGSNVLNVYQLWADRQVHERAALPPGPEIVMPVRFTTPDDPRFESQVAGLPPRYWVVDVLGEASGPDYRASFLVPVYRR